MHRPDAPAASGHEPLDALDDQVRYRMLCRFEKHDLLIHAVTFRDILPPCGEVQIAETAWEALGSPMNLRVTLEVVTRG